MKKQVSVLFAMVLCLAMAVMMTGCGKSQSGAGGTASTTAVRTTVTKAASTAQNKAEKRTLLTKMTVSNGNYSYDYTYDYDFEAKAVSVTAKGVPAGDSPTYEAFTWLLPIEVLKGDTQEALPDSTGANEELTLWAQPLVQSGDIDTYRLTIFEEDAKESSGTLTYKFSRNDKDQVSSCVVNYDWRTGDDYDAVIKYRYNENGLLSRVTETSEARDFVWEFTRDKDGKITHESFQTLEKNENAVDSWLSATNYNYDSDGILVSTSASGEGAQYDSWRTNYLFSETSGTLGALTNQFERVTFTYDESFGELLKVQTTDLETGTDYVTIEYHYGVL